MSFNQSSLLHQWTHISICFHWCALKTDCQLELLVCAIFGRFDSDHEPNRDKKENEHFIKDYNLSSQSVILSKMINQNEAGWKNLDRVWDLLHKEVKLIDYIQTKLTTFVAFNPLPEEIRQRH